MGFRKVPRVPGWLPRRRVTAAVSFLLALAAAIPRVARCLIRCRGQDLGVLEHAVTPSGESVMVGAVGPYFFLRARGGMTSLGPITMNFPKNMLLVICESLTFRSNRPGSPAVRIPRAGPEGIPSPSIATRPEVADRLCLRNELGDSASRLTAWLATADSEGRPAPARVSHSPLAGRRCGPANNPGPTAGTRARRAARPRRGRAGMLPRCPGPPQHSGRLFLISVSSASISCPASGARFVRSFNGLSIESP